MADQSSGGAVAPLNAEAEIKELRHALLDALIVFDIGEDTRFRKRYADVIARAWAADET